MYEKCFISGIRILPMSEPLEFEGKSIHDIQVGYFMDQLIDEDGEYLYRSTGMKSDRDTLVLFQFLNRIIASAILIEVVKDYDHEVYKGYYAFDPESIRIFEPITVNELMEIFDIHRFSQAKQVLNFEKIDKLLDLLDKKYYRFSENHKSLEELYFSSERLKVKVEDVPIKVDSKQSLSKYTRLKRSQINKLQAIYYAGFLCEISPSHQWFSSKITNQNYVEGHHLIPLAYQEEFEYSLDIPANIVSLCPLCHKKIHHAEFEEKRPLIETIFKERVQRLEKCNLDISLNRLLELYR